MFKFSCRPDGGEKFEVIARSRAISAWENAPGQPRGTKRSIGEFTDSLRMTDVTELAWYAADKAGLTDLNVMQWREQVDVELAPYDTDDDEEGPTSPDQ